MQALYRKLYGTLTDAETEDTENSDDPVLRNAPGNFFRLLLARTASKIGDRLSSPKTTLAWLLQTLGAPTIFTGLIVPLRESGSLLPQVLLSNYLKRFARRKWAWTLGAWIQGAAIAGCALVALTLKGTAAGLAIVGLVAVFSLARGISSVSAKDTLGRTIPKSKRGQLTGWAGSASGVIAIGSASFLFFSDGGEGSTGQYLDRHPPRHRRSAHWTGLPDLRRVDARHFRGLRTRGRGLRLSTAGSEPFASNVAQASLPVSCTPPDTGRMPVLR